MIHEDCAIGSTIEGLHKLSELDIYVPYGSSVSRPHWAFQDGAGVKELDDGSSRLVGFPNAQWRWDVITDEERGTLRSFCPGASADIYISTYTNDDVDNVTIFHGIMHWPSEKGEDVAATKRKDFMISFTNLVPVVYY
jgi:hypothetical protein